VRATIDGGQLIAGLAPGQGAAAAGGTPRTQSGVGQEAGAATGGGPPFHFGGPPPALALAGVAARLSEPTVRTAESTAPAITRLK